MFGQVLVSRELWRYTTNQKDAGQELVGLVVYNKRNNIHQNATPTYAHSIRPLFQPVQSVPMDPGYVVIIRVRTSIFVNEFQLTMIPPITVFHSPMVDVMLGAIHTLLHLMEL